MSLSRYHEHTIDLVVGTLEDRRTPVDGLVARALEEGDGSLMVWDPEAVKKFSASTAPVRPAVSAS